MLSIVSPRYFSTYLSGRTLAQERANFVDARGVVEAGGRGAVVDVDGAVASGPAVDADARVPADAVRARCTVLARVRRHGAFVDVLAAVRTCSQEVYTKYSNMNCIAIYTVKQEIGKII